MDNIDEKTAALQSARDAIQLKSMELGLEWPQSIESRIPGRRGAAARVIVPARWEHSAAVAAALVLRRGHGPGDPVLPGWADRPPLHRVGRYIAPVL